MDAGHVLATGTPAELLQRTGSDALEAAFIRLLPEERTRGHAPVLPPRMRAAPTTSRSRRRI